MSIRKTRINTYPMCYIVMIFVGSIMFPNQSSNSIRLHSSMSALAYISCYASMDLPGRSPGHSSHRKVHQNGSIHRSRCFHNTAISSFHRKLDITLLPNHGFCNMNIPRYIQRLHLVQSYIPDEALVFQPGLEPDMDGILFG